MFEAVKYEYIPKPVSHSNVLCIVYFLSLTSHVNVALSFALPKREKKIQRDLKGLSRLIMCGGTAYIKNNTISCRLQTITAVLVN